jgi:hypothetical protein
MTTIKGLQLHFDCAEAEEATKPNDAFEFDFEQDDEVHDFSFFMEGSLSIMQYERISEDANGFLFVTNENSCLNHLPQNWILLDNQSTVSVFQITCCSATFVSSIARLSSAAMQE